MKHTGFFTAVYALVAHIPAGKIMTYGQIAHVLNSPYSAKIVGFAMNAAPKEQQLPCHRVVNRLGEMSPSDIFGGQEAQRNLLASEGVPFLTNGRVNLELARFIPE